MTATDELRKMLDERGVKWMPSVWSAKDETFYKVGEIGYLATELSSGRMKVCIEGYPTPEQAIAATLGPKVCHMSYNELSNTSICLACGWRMDGKPNYCPNCGRRCVG